MARAGILYSHVAQAAATLLENGKNPTVDNVREALGSTGSKSTIAPFLKRWKAEQQDAIAEAESGLPAPLLQAVKGLHQHMQAEASQQIEQARQAHGAAMGEATEREQQLRAGHQAALAANAALTEELARARETLSQLHTAHHAQTVALATVQTENAGLQQRLADRAAEVGALNHQLSQSREQFEHYQEATATQRAEERRSAEQRIARLEQDLAGANRQIAAQQSMLGQQEARIAQQTSDQANLQQALRAAQDDLPPLRSERERLSAQLEEAVAARQRLADQLDAVQLQLTDTRTALAAQERETGMRAEQARRAEERADRLSEEKIDLLQVRATLEQQVRHATSRGDAR
jgi:chromosome segregation ATPase